MGSEHQGLRLGMPDISGCLTLLSFTKLQPPFSHNFLFHSGKLPRPFCGRKCCCGEGPVLSSWQLHLLPEMQLGWKLRLRPHRPKPTVTQYIVVPGA